MIIGHYMHGHIDWARLQTTKKAAQWMNKFWSRICCEVHGGKELQQALEDAEYKQWGAKHRAKRARLMDGEKSGRKGFKAWVEDEVLPATSGWHLL